MSILHKFSLEGQLALVTGANRGLGLAIASGLAEAGADIVNISRSKASKDLEEIARKTGRSIYHITFDLNNLNQDLANQLIEQTISLGGRLDILVNNAGLTGRGKITDLSEESWLHTIQVNQNAAFFLAQAAGKHMIAQGRGKIIQIASLLSYQGGLNVAAYAASKHALLGITRAMANEWAGLGVNVNAIVPGYFLTDLTEVLANDPVRNPAILARVPAGRWAEPEELQGAAVFLASAAADFVHGSTVTVDGGWLAR